MKLIDRDELISCIKNMVIPYGTEERRSGIVSAYEAIAEKIIAMPAVDAEPLRHGLWSRKNCVKKKQYDATTDLYVHAHRCSVCDSVSYFPVVLPDRFCRKCGAKMDGGYEK